MTSYMFRIKNGATNATTYLGFEFERESEAFRFRALLDRRAKDQNLPFRYSFWKVEDRVEAPAAPARDASGRFASKA